MITLVCVYLYVNVVAPTDESQKYAVLLSLTEL